MTIKLIKSIHKIQVMKRLTKTSMLLVVFSVAKTLPYQFHHLAVIK